MSNPHIDEVVCWVEEWSSLSRKQQIAAMTAASDTKNLVYWALDLGCRRQRELDAKICLAQAHEDKCKAYDDASYRAGCGNCCNAIRAQP